MQDERRLQVLRAIVSDYVATNEPVGSRAIVERHHLGVSPATIRNDMAALEEAGLIAQPHTSAGRVPTDAGYRLFVDQVRTIKPMSMAEQRAIVSFLAGAIDLDDVVQRSVRLLAQLTHQVAIVQYPMLSASTVRHVEIVPLTETRLLLVLILSTGRVEQRHIDLGDHALGDDALAEVRSTLLGAVGGRQISEAVAALAPLAEERQRPHAAVVRRLADVLRDAMSDHRTDARVAVGGAANLAGFGTDAFRPLLEALEENVVLLKLLGELDPDQPVTVRIGAEGSVEHLSGTSVVASGYGPGLGTDAQARLGIVGPTRMDYPATMATVRAVAAYVSKILEDS